MPTPEELAVSNPQTVQTPQMNLSMLTDFLLQKTYHEIMVLSELLPRKSDIERKIEIIQFSSRARQQFIRLLALVKWASNSKRLQKCQTISTFLDQQNMHFIDTADMLARISRETLVQARLPNFSLPTAIDVLTTGSFKRLPRCIKDRVVPPEPITQLQTEDIYLKLNNIIKHRLATSKLSPRFTRVSIGSGRLTLAVKDEFEVSLTVMGLDPSLPWRMLKIKFLVQGADVSEGKALVHGLQTQYIHSIVQSRIMSCEEPMLEIYNCLHYFSLSLQLEVFHMQARKLMLERWGNSVKIDAYIVGQKLTISYWRKPVVKSNTNEEIFSITVHADVTTSEPTVHHEPPIYGSTDLLSKKSNLSIEEVLNTAIRKRTLYQLNELCSHLRRDAFFISHCIFDEESVCLRILPFQSCSDNDICRITVDVKSGNFRIFVPDVAMMYKKDMESSLTTDRDAFMKTFNDVRSCLYINAIRTHLNAPGIVILNNLPFYTDEKNSLASISLHRLFLIPSHSIHCLALSISIDSKVDAKTITPKAFIVACTNPSNIKTPVKESTEATRIIQTVFEIDLNSLITSAAISKDSMQQLGTKRKISVLPLSNQKRKAPKHLYEDMVNSSDNQLKDEASIAALLLHFCHRIPFVDIHDQLTLTKIRNKGVVFDPRSGHKTGLLEIPHSTLISTNTHNALQQICFEQCIRMTESFQLTFQIEFSESPFDGISKSYQPDNKLFVSKTIQEGHSNTNAINVVVETWIIISKIFELGKELAMYLNDDKARESLMSCHVVLFDFQQIVVAYGPKKNHKVTISCTPGSHNFNLSFGMISCEQTTNPHHITQLKLIEEFNKHKNVAYLIKVLNCTLTPLSALNTLSAIASMGTTTRLFMPLKDYTILPLSSTRLNLSYRDCFVIEIYMLENGVILRDGSCSSVDPSKSVNNMYPLYQLQEFLSQYSDNSTTRFTTDNDHPSTPANSEMVPMSPAEGILNSSTDGMGSLVSSRDRPMRSPAIPVASPSHVAPSPGQIQSVPSPGTFLQPSPMVSQYNSVSPGGWPPSPLPGSASKSSSQAQRYQSVAPGRCIYPILLSTTSFCELVTGNERRQANAQAPLDRYFGALFFRRHLVRVARTDETLRLEKTDPLSFSGNPLSGVVSTFRLHPTNKDSLTLKVTIKQGVDVQWNADEIRILETYFDTKVACSPYKAHALTAFARLLGAPPKILSDCIKVMLLELNPDQNARWRVEWCLTVPLTMSNFAGTPAVVLKAKSLFFFNFIETHGKRRSAPLSVVFVPDLNQCQTFQSFRPQGSSPEESSFELSMHQAATELLKNYSDTLNGRECSVSNAVIHLMKTLDSSTC